ncbi:multidrug effflux MFS transporter [Microlunatus elymi]|uniref:Multidrug effflux MFS transporter n=1 Tax=Microlunatus elymi TaxID=2596828 RepID=A0A516Q311_9ACTN|nr:multidrug effflux MFS transporter [Microlunatus elymi]QDP97809.1 multidrug effflux MFS transporter [Microlunatus elymi]
MSSTTAPSTAPAFGDRFVGRKYVQLVLLLGALTAIGPLTVDTYLPALPALSAELHAGDASAQLTMTGLLAGLGLGQLIIGPLSDSVGRRKPLIFGLLGHALMSLLCTLAPSITMLIIARTVQGLAGAAVAVVAMAIVRDLFVGLKAAQLLSRLVLVTGVSPILAPSIGSALLAWTDWQGIFVVLAGIALTAMIIAVVALPETLPATRRTPAEPIRWLQSYAGLFGDRLYLIMVAVTALMFAALFAYVAGSPFVLQDVYGLSPAAYGVVFAINAVGLIVMTQLNPLLVKRFGPERVLTGAVITGVAASVTMLITSIAGAGLIGFIVPIFVLLAACGVSSPNSSAIALSRHGEAAGTAAALLGSAQFVIGGFATPLVGALNNGTAVPLAGLMIFATGLAFGLLLPVRARHRRRQLVG